MRLKRYQLEVAEDLCRAALEAHKTGNFFEAAIINFQRIEALLRILITGRGRAMMVVESAVSAIDEEKSFHTLVVFFSLLMPKNQLSRKLFVLNKKRNSLIHKLFIDFESIESLKGELKSFSVEAIKLLRNLTELLEPYLEKKGGEPA